MNMRKILGLFLSLILIFSVVSPVNSVHADSPVGYVTMSVEANTLGVGLIREPVRVPFYAGENYAKVVDRFLNGAANYDNTGSFDSGFYLSKVKLENENIVVNVPTILKDVMNLSNEEIIANGTQKAGYLGEFDYYNMSGWMYSVNNVFPNVGASESVPKDGDVCRWQFTLYGYGSDLGQDNSSFGGDRPLYSAANKDSLLNLVAEINSSPNKVELLAKTAVQTAYQNAKLVLNNLFIDQSSVDRALTELNNSINNVDISTQLDASLGYLLSKVPEPNFGTISGEWSVLTLARGNYNVPEQYYVNYYNRIVNKVKSVNGVLSTAKYTEYSRLILALSAIGKDARDVGGFNLLTPLADFDKTVSQGINGGIFALIALDTNNYEIPKISDSAKQATREKYINYILGKEVNKGTSQAGGFALFGTTPDPDITSMALQALAPYQSMPEVNGAINRALTAISTMQKVDGGFTAFGSTSSESIAQVIVGLTAVGVNPATDSRFIKPNGNLVTALLRFYVNGGGFKHILSGNVDGMATDQGTYALVSFDRYLKGVNSLYKMTDAPVTLVTNQINTLPVTIGLSNEAEVVASRAAYNGLTVAQKGLVSSTLLDKLVAAENKIKSLKNGTSLADSVINQINALPSQIKLTNEVAVVSARTAYNGLTEVQKGLVSSSVFNKLVEAENTLISLKNAVKAVNEKIAALPSISSVRLTNETSIKEARSAYNALDLNQQTLVGSISKLTSAEARLEAIKGDKTLPTIKGVSNNAFYKLNKTIQVSDNVGILNTNLTFNGKSYSYYSSKVFSASGKYTIVATDLIGNKRSIVFYIDKIAPVKPSVKSITSYTTKVVGKAEAYSTVYIFQGSKKIGSSTVSSSGTYTVKIPKQKKRTKLTVYVVDRAGNKGASSTVSVK